MQSRMGKTFSISILERPVYVLVWLHTAYTAELRCSYCPDFTKVYTGLQRTLLDPDILHCLIQRIPA